MATKQNNIVHGEPTKDFFINMLIKDITLRDAIGDLVDNSVDGIKAKVIDRENLKGYNINIVADTKHFKIEDNGSGIEENIAREYAFKLGKPKKHGLIEKSIGRFGIGMKRAFFKLGEHITVRSIAPTSRFSIILSVNDWKDKEDEWNLNFHEVMQNQKNSKKITGTQIIITELSEDAKESFKKTLFENILKDEIAREQTININKGLTIKINGEVLKPSVLTLKYNKEIIPAYWKHTFEHNNSKLDVEIYTGVSEEIESEGGWNIYCNDRLIVDRDTTELTGWTGLGGDGVAKYHQQFWGFRGFVFFEAKDSSLLPWNTTKTGLDQDSPNFVTVRKKMIEMMKDVILLLNRQKKEREKDNPEKDQALNNKVYSAKDVSLLKIVNLKSELSAKFQFPSDLNLAKVKDVQNIKYEVPTIKFNKVKKRLSAVHPSDVGSKTFDYYYENEIGD